MTLSEWAMLIVLSLLWGASFFFIAITVRELPPITIVVLRVGLAALALLALVRAMGLAMLKGGRVWLAFLAMGFLSNVLPFCLIVWGQTRIASGLASVLNATTPLFTVVAAHYFTNDEKMTANKLAGVVIGFLGVAVMIGTPASAGFGSDLWGELAVLVAAASYAFAAIYGRRFMARGISPLSAAAGQLSAATLLLIPLALLADRPWALAMPGHATWAALAAVAFLSTALAYVLFYRILATAGPTNLMLVTFLIPVSAILLGTFVLGERLELRHFLGIAMIAAGLAAVDGRLIYGFGKREARPR
jgi:drug/metabolite transporter (DMT)-like permease